jgi:hypothetical protein
MHPRAAGIVNRIGDSPSAGAHSQLAYALCLDRACRRIAFFDHHNLQIRDVAMDWHMIFGEVTIHQMAVFRIEQQSFGQRAPDAPDHAAQTLRPSGLLVQNPPEAEGPCHAAHAVFTSPVIYSDFGEKRAIACRGKIVADAARLIVALDGDCAAVQNFDHQLLAAAPVPRQRSINRLVS